MNCNKLFNIFKPSKNNNENQQDVFVVIIMSYFGDALVGNGLFQNIKRIYPNSKTVFIINKPYYEVAKYQKDVDEVIVYDKNKLHKGFFGIFKFVWNFPYKKVKYVFKMCKKERVDIISLLLRPEKIVNYNYNPSIPTHKRYCDLLKEVTNKEMVYPPISYIADDDIPQKFANIISKTNKYVALCTISSKTAKDMPLQSAIELIDIFKNNGYSVIFVGVGERTKNYATELKENGCNIIDLSNQTTIYELSQILRNCEALVSVDTGTMHLGYANKVPTACVFYHNTNIQSWAPNKSVYSYTEVITDTNPQNIYNKCAELIKQNNSNLSDIT